MGNINYYILDTETTGLKAGYHEVNQISIINFQTNKQSTVNIAVAYPMRANPEALKIQNKTKYDLKDGIDRDSAVKKISEFIETDGSRPGERCIVGHNVAFDRRFVHATWEASGVKFPADLWLCTKSFTKRIADKRGMVKPKLKLADAMQIMGLDQKFGAHNAVIDTINTKNLFASLLQENIPFVRIMKNVPHNL